MNNDEIAIFSKQEQPVDSLAVAGLSKLSDSRTQKTCTGYINSCLNQDEYGTVWTKLLYK